MALKETEGSLRTYLIAAGAISILLGLRDTSDLNDLQGVALPLDWTLAVYVPLVSDFVLGAAFIAAGIRLKAELRRGAGWIKTMLVASGAMLFINGALIVSVFGTEIGRSGIGHALVGLAITIYLHRSVVRLSNEAAARDGIAPPPPTAKVV